MRATRCLWLVLALAAGPVLGPVGARVARADLYAGLTPGTITVSPGDTVTVHLDITQADAQFNAFDASIEFDPAMLTFLPAATIADQRGPVMTSACSNTFHQFHATPDSLKITLSLLCGGTFVTGPGTVYSVRFVAGATNGTTTLHLGPFTNFYNAGIYVLPLHTQDMVITIGSATGVAPAAGRTPLEFAAPAPNPGHGAGRVELRFTLPAPDEVAFDVLDVGGRRVAGREAEAFTGGVHVLAWTAPPLDSGTYFVRLRTRASGAVVQRWSVLH